MIEFIKSLKIPSKITTGEIRNYGVGTPTVTGLLSLIDSYEPKNDEALDRGTYVHEYMEKTLLGLKGKSGQYTEFISSVMPYVKMFKTIPGEELILEQKLSIPGVFGGTPDYIKKVSDTGCLLDDYKTATQLSSIAGDMLNKYTLQSEGYSMLIREVLKLETISKSIFVISPKGCYHKQLRNNNSSTITDRTKIDILITYYHILNGTIETKEVKDYIVRRGSLIKGLLDIMYDKKISGDIRYKTLMMPIAKLTNEDKK